MYLSIKANRVWVPVLCGAFLTSCCVKSCYQERVEIPNSWHTTFACSAESDPACYRWWEAMGDPVLTSLIEEAAYRNEDVQLAALGTEGQLLQAMNEAAAEIAKSYIRLWGSQQRLQIIEDDIEAQKRLLTHEEGLLTTGLIDSVERNDQERSLDAYWVQKSAISLAIKKESFHLSTLLGEPPGSLCGVADGCLGKLQMPCEFPVGCPLELVCRHPGLKEAKKAYDSCASEEAYYNYRKQVYSVLENVEGALAALSYARQSVERLGNSSQLKDESYKATLDLFQRGLKGEREVAVAYEEWLAVREAWLQGRVELLTSYVNLYEALSVGWEACCGCK